MKITNKNIKDIIPYGNNPRYNEKSVQYVANSIREFGFQQPIVVDKDNVIIVGHTRYLASKLIGLNTVPVVVADMLSDEQVRAYRLADNKVGESSEWDMALLNEELENIIDIDMEEFDFNIDDINDILDEIEDKHQQEKETTQTRKANILNLEFAQFEGVGKYDIPQIEPIQMEDIGEIKEWIPFNYVMSDKEPQGKAVHFFIDDYQFVRVWNEPLKYIEKLKQYECVLSPDFSPYGDMPMATQIFNHYRKHWIARLWQENGIKVIPTIRASTDERSLSWYLDGEPKGGIVCISNMWTKDKQSQDYFLNNEYKNMIDTLHPSKIFVYGHERKELQGVEYIKTFAESRWNDAEGN